jgi:hypothetical protein
MIPVERRRIDAVLKDEVRLSFEGVGFAVNGAATSEDGRNRILKAEMTIDGRPAGTWDLPTDFLRRSPTPFWAYGLPPGPHEVRMKLLNGGQPARLKLDDMIIYRGAPEGGAVIFRTTTSSSGKSTSSSSTASPGTASGAG